MTQKIMCIVGARPNFMKIAPIMRAFANSNALSGYLVHTGQHYDHVMSERLFQQLDIPTPDIDLEVGSGSHAVQTADIMKSFEPVLDREQPAAVLVVGDVNSTIGCGLVAVKKGVPLIHVEAGLRSFDRQMPEEINRVLTDQISDILFTTEPTAAPNLAREGIDEARVQFVGNVMIDTLFHNLPRALKPADWLAEKGLSGDFALLTLHRPSNVDDPAVLGPMLETIARYSQQLPVVFPIHPRTKGRLQEFGFDKLLEQNNFICTEPAGYLEMLGLMNDAKLVLTDSGGIQEETTALGTPCLTLRENTERPITVDEGTNTIVGTDPAKIAAAIDDVLASGGKAGKRPPLWDGKAAERIAAAIDAWLQSGAGRAG